MCTKRNALFFGILTICIVAGCELSSPTKVGSYCPGISIENVQHISSDECMKDDTCAAEDGKAVEMGYCPAEFECVDNHGVPQCRRGCESNKIMCSGECIDPLISTTNCGAKLEGACNSTSSGSPDYRGEDCRNVVSSLPMVCINGHCQENTCEADKHPVLQKNGTTICEGNTSEACGSVDIKCKKTEVCKAGFCQESCPSDEVICNSRCIDPLISNEYCGADEKCEGFDVCTDGKVCANGRCRILDCPDNQMRCINGETEQCMDIVSDPLNCGTCDYDCDAHRPANAVTVGCSDRKCVYRCENGYENCGSGEIMECVDLSGTRSHCGSCENACVGKQFCKDSRCAESDCTPYECPQAEQCKKNDPEACGLDCFNCNLKYHATNSTCDDTGVCHYSICESGYHLAGTEGSYTCVENSLNSCGSTDKVDAIDCKSISQVDSVTCDSANGYCKVKSCKSNYHVLNNTSCEKDDDNNCGSHGHKCQIANGTSKCQSGKCTISCNDGYHLSSSNDACIKDSDTECGSKRENCQIINKYGWNSGKCSSGRCVAKSCQSGYSLVDEVCIMSCYETSIDYVLYCCRTKEDAQKCSHSSCDNCFDDIYFTSSPYGDVYEACIGELFDKGPSSIYCDDYDCNGWRDAKANGSFKYTNLLDFTIDTRAYDRCLVREY